MTKYFLFDLDGTILKMDIDEFVHGYFKALGAYFMDLCDPKALVGWVMKATDKMVMDNSDDNNFDTFFRYFIEISGVDSDIYKERFNKFYEEKFDKLKGSCEGNKELIEAIHLLKEAGYGIVVATNPIFPMIAVEHRLGWTGMKASDFEYVTAMEVCTNCKPNPEYFKDILKKIDATPEQCVMVGNDPLEDLAASEAGIKTWLITDCIMDRKPNSYKADYEGSGEDFLKFIKALLNEVK